MQMNKLSSDWTKILSLIVMFIGLSIAYAPFAFAESNYVHDEANVLSASMKEKLNQLLSDLEKGKNIRIEEVILPTVGTQDPSTVAGEIVQKLDSKASPAENQAVIIFIIDNGFIQIYPNQKLAAALDEKTIASIIKNASKSMQDKKYDEMARVGVAGVYHYFQKSNAGNGAGKESSSKKPLLNIAFALLVLVVIVGLIKFSNKKSL